MVARRHDVDPNLNLNNIDPQAGLSDVPVTLQAPVAKRIDELPPRSWKLPPPHKAAV